MAITPSPSHGHSEFLMVLKAHLAEYRNKPLLNVGFIVSLAIATSTLLSILVLNDASKQQYQDANSRLKSPVAFYIVADEQQHVSMADFVRLRQLGFHQLSATHVFEKTMSNGNRATFRAIDILPAVLLSPESYTSKTLNVSQQYAAKLGLTGKQLMLDGSEPIDINVNQANDWGNVILLDFALAWQLFPDIKGYSHLMASEMSERERSLLAQALPPHLSIQEAWSIEEREGFADALHLNLSALATLGFIVSLFIAYQAANQAWATRSLLATKLRLLGIELKVIKRVMLCESLLLTLMASLLGISIAMMLISVLLPVLGITLEQLYRLRLSGHFQWQWLYSIWAFLISAVAVFMALINQFRRISSAKVAFNARTTIVDFSYRVTLLVSAALFALFLVWPSEGWLQLMTKYGVLLLASVAMLPLFLKGLLRLMTLLTSSFRAKFVFKDASQQIGRRFLPVAAFYLALTSSISAALMVNSFESSFVSYLNQLLNSDMFVSYRTEQKDALQRGLEQHQDIAEYALFKQTTAKYQQDTVRVYNLDSKRQQESLLLKTELSSALVQKDEHHCFINEQFSLKHHLLLGSDALLKQGQHTFACRVVGVFYDYGNQGLAIKVPTYGEYAQSELGLSAWEDIGFGVFLKPDAELDKLSFIQAFSLDEEQVYQPEQIKTIALDVFEQTFVLTQAIAFVLLAIACFGLFLSASSLELSRKPDLHILSSLGYSRVALLLHMLSQWLVLALGAILLSWPVAIALANALVSLVLPASFGWSMPLVINAGPFATSSLIGLGLLIPALALPLYKLNLRASLS